MNFTINFIFTKSTEFVYNLTRNIGNGFSLQPAKRRQAASSGKPQRYEAKQYYD